MWGLLCTALEYDAIDEREDTRAFWDLVENRYLAYAFGTDAPKRDLLRSMLRLAPRLSAEYPAIAAFRDVVRQHPFPFMPFHEFSRDDVKRVLAYAETRIAGYRDDVWDERGKRAMRWVRRRMAPK